MSRSDTLTFRWSLVLSLLLAAFLGIWHLWAGAVPQDDIGLTTISRWWLLLAVPLPIYATVRLFGLGQNEDYHAMYRRQKREFPFWLPVWILGIASFMTSPANDGLPFFASYAAMGVVMGGVCLAASRLLPPLGAWIARWRIWSVAARYLKAE